jgi:hypothetical protein
LKLGLNDGLGQATNNTKSKIKSNQIKSNKQKNMIRCLLGLNDGLGQATKARRKEEKKNQEKKKL